MPLNRPLGYFAPRVVTDDESLPLAALAGDQFDGARADLDDVIRLWLSSVRPNYRRPVRGRSTLRRYGAISLHGRHSSL